MRGMQRRSRRAVLPSLHIGSTANEITGTNVIPDPHRRKRNQRVMNHRQSTSISGKHEPENLAGEGAERQAAELAQPARRRREAGEGSFEKVGEETVVRNPSPGRSPSGGALRRPAVSRPPSPTRTRVYPSSSHKLPKSDEIRLRLGEGIECAAPESIRSTAIGRARELRSRMTDAERKLWFALRDRRFASFKFRRQAPIGPFIADFICHELRVVIEADGGQHSDSRSDQRRDDWFARNDFLVLRFWNNDVLSNREGVLTAILEALHSRRKHGAKERMS